MKRHRWVKGLCLALLLAAGCDKKKPCVGASCNCFSNEDCGHGICFLGSCQSPGYNIQKVYVDLSPSATSELMAQTDASSPRDLSQGLNFNITLQRPHTLAGQVSAQSGVTLGGLVTARIHQSSSIQTLLPSALTLQQASVGSDSTYTLALVPGLYDVTFTPAQGVSAARPPQSLARFAITGDTEQNFAYPDGALVSLGGVVLSVPQTAQNGVQGAQISAVGVSDSGATTLSTSAITDPNGAYTLFMLPGASTFNATVRPGPAAQGNPLVPTMTFTDLPLHAAQFAPLVLDVPGQAISITANVTDQSGTAITNAAVFFDGMVGSPNNIGTFAANATTNATGQAQVTLMAGSYAVNVVPASDQSSAAVVTQLCANANGAMPLTGPCSVTVTHDGTLTLRAGVKIPISGTVLSNLGRPVAGARVVYTPYNDAARRQFTTVSRSDGTYSITVDPAASLAETVDYTIGVEPDSTSGLPRHLEYYKIGAEPATHDIRLFAPSFVYGHVYDPDGASLADVTIAFYVEQGSTGLPLLVGLGKSSAAGEFVIPLPTANDSN